MQIKKFGRCDPIIGAWNYGFFIGKNPVNNFQTLSFWFFKLISLPDKGMIVQKRHYTGFWIRFSPHVVVSYRFRIGRFHLEFPLKIKF